MKKYLENMGKAAKERYNGFATFRHNIIVLRHCYFISGEHMASILKYPKKRILDLELGRLPPNDNDLKVISVYFGITIENLLYDTPKLVFDEHKEFFVECAVCKQQLRNWTGSTPCCGSIAYLVGEDGKVSNSINVFASINDGDIKPTLINL